MGWERHGKICEPAEKEDFFIDYEAVFREWEEFKIMEKVTGDIENGHFLPHRPVAKMDSGTTKIRSVLMSPLENAESVP